MHGGLPHPSGVYPFNRSAAAADALKFGEFGPNISDFCRNLSLSPLPATAT
jgi:hypothetical protein